MHGPPLSSETVGLELLYFPFAAPGRQAEDKEDPESLFIFS